MSRKTSSFHKDWSNITVVQPHWTFYSQFSVKSPAIKFTFMLSLNYSCCFPLFPSMKPNLKWWGGLSNKQVSTSASTRRERLSDAITFELNKRIFFYTKLRFVVIVAFPSETAILFVSVWHQRKISLQRSAERGQCLIMIN